MIKEARVALAVESMRRHMTDEGWQIMLALKSTGYLLCGFDNEKDPVLDLNSTDVEEILRLEPGVIVVQDKREWEGLTADRSRDPRMRFAPITALRDRSDIFKATILKDAHQDTEYNRVAAEEMGCDAWIIYYHPKTVKRLAPYVREQHLIRTYHSLDPEIVPEYRAEPRNPRKRCVVSGAVSSAYPLRKWIISNSAWLGVHYIRHPGYHRNGCATPAYLRELMGYKVAICTCSVFGYALRKIIEATACGCRVITNLPSEDVLPEIDGNLVRLSDPFLLKGIIDWQVESYDPERQADYALRAKRYYDYKNLGRILGANIEEMKRCHPQ